MTSLADQLPPEIAQHIHPQWCANEAYYWAARDRLLPQYRGQWIGFADGTVVACGCSPVAVFHAAVATGRHPFVTCVGGEEEPYRMRRQLMTRLSASGPHGELHTEWDDRHRSGR
jgi:hypothetical protein